MNAYHWSLIALVAILLVAAFMRRRSHSPLECPKCHSKNNYLTYGDFYALCQDCAWKDEDLAKRIADRAKSDPHYTPYN